MIDHQLRQRFRRHPAQTAQRAAAAQKALGDLPGTGGGGFLMRWIESPGLRHCSPDQAGRPGSTRNTRVAAGGTLVRRYVLH